MSLVYLCLSTRETVTKPAAQRSKAQYLRLRCLALSACHVCVSRDDLTCRPSFVIKSCLQKIFLESVEHIIFCFYAALFDKKALNGPVLLDVTL